ncbi:MAG TPA: HD-GYP domain-containing protein [Chloroflexia bacterium]|nr:HD-GYP domain-containing protein [Chloroflexia bacterium]
MLPTLKKSFPQPLIAATLMALVCLALGGAWRLEGSSSIQAEQALLTVFLVLGVIAAYRFPIHVGFRQKVEMTTVPIYLMAVLLPDVALAATAAGIGVLAAELTVRAQRGNYVSDVLTSAGRWVLAVLPAAVVAHSPLFSGLILHLMLAALVLGIGELLTLPLLLGPLTGDSPSMLIRTALRETSTIEASQYLLGILGALAATYQPWAVLLLALPTTMVYRAFKAAKEMQAGTRQMVEQMADTVDLRDPYTGGHSRRVMKYTERILQELDIQGKEVDLIATAARVHDLGKMAIPDAILEKPGPLTVEEQVIMQAHAERGADFLARYPDFARGVEMVRHHHENWDGTGYPGRLKGTEIPFGARIIAVADGYDAMTSDRPYRAAMAPDTVAGILWRGRNKQWDGEIVDAFLRAMELQVSDAPMLQILRVEREERSSSVG